MGPTVEVAHEQLDEARKLLHRIRMLDNAHVRKGGSTAFSSGPMLNPFYPVDTMEIFPNRVASHRISPYRTVGRPLLACTQHRVCDTSRVDERSRDSSLDFAYVFSAEKLSGGTATDIPFSQCFFLQEDSGLPARRTSSGYTCIVLCNAHWHPYGMHNHFLSTDA